MVDQGLDRIAAQGAAEYVEIGSPEFERRPDPDEGLRRLERLARDTGGTVSPAAGELFRGEREARRHRSIARELALAGLLLVILEIAFRRLNLWSRWSLGDMAQTFRERAAERRIAKRAAAEAQPEPEPTPLTPGTRRPQPTGTVSGAIEAARRSAARKLER